MAKQPKPWQPPTPAKVVELWRECVNDMLEVRRNHVLNDSFFNGDQWVSWNDSSGTVNLVPFTVENAGSRATVNKIKPRVITFEARLVATPLAFEPQPEGVDANAVRKAKLSGQVLDALAHRHGWERRRREVVDYCMMSGCGAIVVEPDWEFGDEEVVVDEETGDKVRLPSRPKVKVDSLSGLEFGIEPGTRREEDARWWIRNTTLTPAQARERYKLAEDPPADAHRGGSAMGAALLSRRKENRARGTAVFVYYERPSDVSPGCVLHVVDNKIVQQSGWPFSFDHLNIVTFRQTHVAGTWKGSTIVTDARPLQVTINRTQTTINGYLGVVDNVRILLPHGAVMEGEDEFTGEMGEVIRHEGGFPPSYMQPPLMQRWLPDIIVNTEAEMDDLFSAHAVSRGEAPGDRNSGLALSILAEKDQTPLGLMAVDQQAGWQKTAEMVLMTEKALMGMADDQFKAAGMDRPPMQATDVLMKPDGQGGASQATEVSWTAADLPDMPVVLVPLENVMPKSDAAIQDMFLKVAAVPAFTAMFAQMTGAQLAAVLRVPGLSAFSVIGDPQEEEADWENTRMASGAGDNEVIVQTWQDHNIHVTRHNALRASAAYRDDPMVQKFVDMHIDGHAKLAAEELLQQQQAQAALNPAPAGPQPAGAPPAGPDQTEGIAA